MKQRLVKYGVEVLVGLSIAALVFIAVVATVGTVPFIYQGY